MNAISNINLSVMWMKSVACIIFGEEKSALTIWRFWSFVSWPNEDFFSQFGTIAISSENPTRAANTASQFVKRKWWNAILNRLNFDYGWFTLTSMLSLHADFLHILLSQKQQWSEHHEHVKYTSNLYLQNG